MPDELQGVQGQPAPEVAPTNVMVAPTPEQAPATAQALALSDSATAQSDCAGSCQCFDNATRRAQLCDGEVAAIKDNVADGDRDDEEDNQKTLVAAV